MLTVSSSKFWATVAMLPILLFGSGSAQAAPWTAVGSTGVVDEADLQMFSFNNGQAAVSSAVAAPATLDLRYNIVGIDELGDGNFTSGGMRVRFRDNGSNAQVLLSLKAYNHDAGTYATLATFNSNNHSSSSSYQVYGVCFPLTSALDFSENAYFIDAQLIKSGSGGTPELGTIMLTKQSCGQ